MKTPDEILSSCDNMFLVELLEEKLGKDNVTDKKRKNVIKHLKVIIREMGLKTFLTDLHIDILRDAHKEVTSNSKSVGKAVATSDLMEFYAKGKTLNAFFNRFDGGLLTRMVEDYGLEVDKDKTEAIISFVDEYGFKHFLSSLNDTRLSKFADHCQLKVNSRSREILIDSIMEQKDFEPKKKPTVKPSKKKPKIKSGITSIDLSQHYSKEELEDYCKEEEIPHSGKKSEIVRRILKYLEGEDVKTKPKKRKASTSKKGKKKSPSKTSPSKKVKRESGEQSSKSKEEKEEKIDVKDDKSEGKKHLDREDKSEKETSPPPKSTEKDKEKPEKEYNFTTTPKAGKK